MPRAGRVPQEEGSQDRGHAEAMSPGDAEGRGVSAYEEAGPRRGEGPIGRRCRTFQSACRGPAGPAKPAGLGLLRWSGGAGRAAGKTRVVKWRTGSGRACGQLRQRRQLRAPSQTESSDLIVTVLGSLEESAVRTVPRRPRRVAYPASGAGRLLDLIFGAWKRLGRGGLRIRRVQVGLLFPFFFARMGNGTAVRAWRLVYTAPATLPRCSRPCRPCSPMPCLVGPGLAGAGEAPGATRCRRAGSRPQRSAAQSPTQPSPGPALAPPGPRLGSHDVRPPIPPPGHAPGPRASAQPAPPAAPQSLVACSGSKLAAPSMSRHCGT